MKKGRKKDSNMLFLDVVESHRLKYFSNGIALSSDNFAYDYEELPAFNYKGDHFNKLATEDKVALRILDAGMVGITISQLLMDSKINHYSTQEDVFLAVERLTAHYRLETFLTQKTVVENGKRKIKLIKAYRLNDRMKGMYLELRGKISHRP
ncbi:MAG: hypothetical protein JSW70_05670 [Syntrophobacterales bacterium]|nr:MAG: hypothetical protein JSW70_05670 [Syntrophobacterales bacterium]